MRTKKALLNSATALLLELVTVVCGFILPRLILATFGSKYNGITSSITQFLSYIALLKAGIGGVTRASLYKPLQENDTNAVSAIIKATEKYMRQVAIIFAVFIVGFAAVYPFAVSNEFDWLFSFSLVLILGIGTFSQYYFGITYQMLLQADQRQYVYSLFQIFTTIANTIIASILINMGCSIHIVKIGSAIVFTLTPIFLNFYVRRKYSINHKVEANKAAIAQRWDSFAHQIANFVHGNTDVVILTLFSTMPEVSVYTVYALVVSGVRKLVYTLGSGVEAAFGNMLAKKEDDLLRRNLELFEYIMFYVSGFCFSCAMVLIVPFVRVYTDGVTDADYIRPLFGIILCIAEFLWCLRLPYQYVVLAAGKYKETRNGAIAEPIINIVISVCLVFKYGITGVAIGTVVAMIFRTIQYAVFMSKNVVKRPIWIFIKKLGVIFISVVVACFLSLIIDWPCQNYLDWVILASIRSLIIVTVYGLFTLLFERKNFTLFCSKLKSVIKRKGKNHTESSC